MNSSIVLRNRLEPCFLLLAAGIVVILAATSVIGQIGNTVSGHVFGLERRPLYDAYVELQDEFSRLVSRTRTDSSGRYFFNGVPPGRLNVRVFAPETDYEEQTQSLEIVNFARETATGQRRLSGFSNEQLDFYMKPKRGSSSVTGAVFVQDVPDNAKALYEKAIASLEAKKEQDGLRDLKAAIEAFPKYYVALERLGNEYVRSKHFEAARILLALAVEVNPRGYRAWFGLAYSLNELGKIEEGLIAARKAVEIYNRGPESLLLLGVLLRSQKQFDDAEKQMLKAIEVAADTVPAAHWQLALLYGNDLKRYKDAAKQLRLFLKAQPDAKDAENIKKLIAEFETKDRTKS